MTSVVLWDPRYEHNVGGAIRACACFDVGRLFWTGSRVVIDRERRKRIPREERMRSYSHVEFARHQKPFDALINRGAVVAVELTRTARSLTHFTHPVDCTYVFGPEDGSIPKVARRHCHQFVYIPARHCLNLAAAVNVVLAHRLMQRQAAGLAPDGPPSQLLDKHRGPA